MPYVPKAKDLDTIGGPLRIAGRDVRDAAASITSATSGVGGAPSVAEMPEQMTAKSPPIPKFNAAGPVHLADFGDVLPQVVRPKNFDATNIRPDDMGMINELAGAVQEWAQRNPIARQALELMGSPQELATRIALTFQRNLETIRSDVPLPSRVYASREAGNIAKWLEDLRARR